jgi:2-hydroxychromene-2-carboxylate isomerase
MRQVDFYFGLGSRYSYLAATQVPRIARETGAHFVWRPLYSRVLIARAGRDPFAADGRRGQYEPAYRTKDAQRWARCYGVPYAEPDWDAID